MTDLTGMDNLVSSLIRHLGWFNLTETFRQIQNEIYRLMFKIKCFVTSKRLDIQKIHPKLEA